MSERMRCVVASPKTENISAMALVVMAKTTRPWSVKSTVSKWSVKSKVSIRSSNAFVVSEGPALVRCCAVIETFTQSVSFHTSDQFGNRLCVPPDRDGTQKYTIKVGTEWAVLRSLSENSGRKGLMALFEDEAAQHVRRSLICFLKAQFSRPANEQFNLVVYRRFGFKSRHMHCNTAMSALPPIATDGHRAYRRD